MTNYIPFVDLSTQYDAIKSEIDYAIKIDPQKFYLDCYTLTRYPNNHMKK